MISLRWGRLGLGWIIRGWSNYSHVHFMRYGVQSPYTVHVRIRVRITNNTPGGRKCVELQHRRLQILAPQRFRDPKIYAPKNKPYFTKYFPIFLLSYGALMRILAT
jgi:hypothetical protein